MKTPVSAFRQYQSERRLKKDSMKIKGKKIRKRNKGFSLAEVLVVLLIVLMVSSIVAVGVPAAVRAYNKVVDASNAEVLLSTAMIRLREELGTAGTANNAETATTITYDCGQGYESKIMLAEETEEPSILIQEYSNIPDLAATYPPHPLVTDSASSKKLYVTYDTVDISADGIITFGNLQVKHKQTGKTYAKLETFKIRMLAV